MNDGKLSGWRLVGLAIAVIGAGLALALVRHGWTDEGLRGIIRVTARTSFGLFLAAFAASSLAALFPTALTRWLLANRRYLGISFAISHLVHGAAIVTLAVRTGGGSLTARVIGLGSASLLFGFIFLMLVTSFDGPAAWLGPRWWKRLHTTGSYLVFLSFLATYGRLVPQSRAFLFQVVLLLGVLALRLARRSRTTSRSQSQLSQT